MVRVGKFISVEGGEGVGKSTFLSKLSTELSAVLNTELVVSREPGGSPLAESLRQLFLSPPEEETLTREAEFLMVNAARAQHIAHTIDPALGAGSWVLCDRFKDSTRVYQGILGSINSELIEKTFQLDHLSREPDLTFVFFFPVEISTARIAQREKTTQTKGTRFDEASAQEHIRTRDAFLDLAKKFPSRIRKLNANLHPDRIVAEAMQIIVERFNLA